MKLERYIEVKLEKLNNLNDVQTMEVDASALLPGRFGGSGLCSAERAASGARCLHDGMVRPLPIERPNA